ncbi:RNA polymerase sigma factor [Nannocystis radixulma]|uniref:RNA polymerase sigma factor n=1 Tax=Nannocystis radixulma TaxID=2995305 RepID=A0ABT5BCI3_9BACT|nr:RNA polymerase sigma factor [Nannocystis radixulma]MDC0671854.1 RNA polymerase sigma factor [Nannocystis radixulma]
MSDDAELLTRWRAGDAAAGSALVRRHVATLARFFRGKTGDLADVVQQTLTACVQARDRLPEGLEFRAWLLGIARNVLLHDLRRRGRKPEPDLLDDQGLAAPSVLSPSRAVAARAERRLLLRALRRLPYDLQWLIELHYWEDLRQDDVAVILEIPPGTVKSRLSRAKRLLRAEIEALAADPALRASTVDDLDRWAREVAGRDDDE